MFFTLVDIVNHMYTWQQYMLIQVTLESFGRIKPLLLIANIILMNILAISKAVLNINIVQTVGWKSISNLIAICLHCAYASLKYINLCERPQKFNHIFLF